MNLQEVHEAHKARRARFALAAMNVAKTAAKPPAPIPPKPQPAFQEHIAPKVESKPDGHSSRQADAHVWDYRRAALIEAAGPLTDDLKKHITAALIVHFTAEHFCINPAEIRGDSRVSNIQVARQVACFLAYRLRGATLHMICRDVVHRDHTSVLNAIRSIERQMASNPRLAAEVGEITANIILHARSRASAIQRRID